MQISREEVYISSNKFLTMSCVFLHVKSHNFPPNCQISREGASQIPHFFQPEYETKLNPFTSQWFKIDWPQSWKFLNITASSNCKTGKKKKKKISRNIVKICVQNIIYFQNFQIFFCKKETKISGLFMAILFSKFQRFPSIFKMSQ